MIKFKAKTYGCSILLSDNDIELYPYLRHDNGDKEVLCASPTHGRSYIVAKHNDGRYVVSKGNGLSYTTHTFLNTGEMGLDTWGLLLRQDAIRDYIVGNEIKGLGIKTNHMECVIELHSPLMMPNGTYINPTLLQYSVECPFRLCDAPFMDYKQIETEVIKWEVLNSKGYDKKYLIAADILIRNLHIMHEAGILHNAIHNQNYTLALELLDFELSHTPNYPYKSEDYVRHVPSLMPREVIQTYEIINYIAGVLREDVDNDQIDNMFREYGYNLNSFKLL